MIWPEKNEPGKSGRDIVREAGGVKSHGVLEAVPKSLVYSKCNGKPLEDFNQGQYMI